MFRKIDSPRYTFSAEAHGTTQQQGNLVFRTATASASRGDGLLPSRRTAVDAVLQVFRYYVVEETVPRAIHGTE